jgi:peptidyl-prolyl cis-trans isomerase C
MNFRYTAASAALLLTAALGLSGCSGESSSAKSSDVLATVNGEDVEQASFQAYLKYKRISESDSKAAEAALDGYLQREGLASAILSQNKLDSIGIETEVNEFRKQMLISRYFEQYLRDSVNEAAMRNFYAEHADRYQSKRVHVAHVLIRTNPKMSEQEREALLTKAQEVYSKAVSSEDFAQLAEQYSDDALSAKKGGDLGWISDDAIDPAFIKAAISLKKDEVSQPVATPFGFHVIKVLDEAQIVKRPYESVKGDIRFELRQQAKKAEMERLKSLVTVEKRG